MSAIDLDMLILLLYHEIHSKGAGIDFSSSEIYSSTLQQSMLIREGGGRNRPTFNNFNSKINKHKTKVQAAAHNGQRTHINQNIT